MPVTSRELKAASSPTTSSGTRGASELTADNRTSLVVDPPNGRIPYKPEHQQASRIRGLNLRNGFADSYTDRSLADRCILGFNAGPPMVSSAYNNNVQIFQIPGYVVILNEMVHNARIIPFGDDDDRHGLPQWSGDSRGRWEGRNLCRRDEELPPRDQPGRLVEGHDSRGALPPRGSPTR